jgi:hypothetical protein
MSTAPEHTVPAAHSPRQFSLRFLFKLTLVIAILLTIGVFHSLWTPFTIAIPLAVWFIDHVRLVTPRWLAHASIALFGISLCVPAFSLRIMGPPDLIFGWLLFAGSFMVLPDIFFSEFLVSEPSEFPFALAYTAGAAANVCFLTGYIAHFFAQKSPRASTYARRAALLTLPLAGIDLVALLTADEVVLIYPGFGCWTAAMLALYLGMRRPT